MFEDYLQDAYAFYNLAENRLNVNDEREAKMFFRASIFCASSAMEAFVNFIGETFRQGDTLDKAETAFLNDKILEFSPEKLKTQEKTKYNSIDSKVKFIIKRFNVDIDLAAAKQWHDFVKLKNIRDGLIHAKEISDENSLKEYQNNIKVGLNANIDIMNAISSKLFSKPLRKGISELKIS